MNQIFEGVDESEESLISPLVGEAVKEKPDCEIAAPLELLRASIVAHSELFSFPLNPWLGRFDYSPIVHVDVIAHYNLTPDC